jgi:hypothetical protein
LVISAVEAVLLPKNANSPRLSMLTTPALAIIPDPSNPCADSASVVKL